MADTESVEKALLGAMETLAKRAAEADNYQGAEQLGSAVHHLAEAYSLVSGDAFRLEDLQGPDGE